MLTTAGAGESGKSTVLKQMKLIYSQGFSNNEKLEWKPVIFSNIVQSFQVITDAMQEMGIEFENKENEASNQPNQPNQPRWPAGQLASWLGQRANTATEQHGIRVERDRGQRQ